MTDSGAGETSMLQSAMNTVLVAALIVALWRVMWSVFFRHVPLLAHIKAMAVGDKQEARIPRGKPRGVVFAKTAATTGPQR
jgi:hypothetical protein